jgi:P4 family phage/plasmid primase-like protien
MSGHIDIRRAQDEGRLLDFVGGAVKLAKDGPNRHSGLCPFHQEKSPSFTIFIGNDGKERFHCFGCGKHGDVLDYVMETRGVNIHEAAKMITGEIDDLGSGAQRRKDAPPPIDPYENITPLDVPADAPKIRVGNRIEVYNPKRERYTNYSPHMVFRYDDSSGFFGYVIRQDLDNGRKITPMIMWCATPKCPDGEWSHYTFPKPRPLYGLNYKKPSGQILIVEGEKTADAARKALKTIEVVCWAGGTQAVEHSDFSVLEGRDVIICPDNDEPGITAANEIAVIAHRHGAKKIRIVNVSEKPAKWDLADEPDWDKKPMLGFLKENAIAWAPPAEPKSTPADVPAPTKWSETASDHEINEVGEAAIALWFDGRGPLMMSQALAWTYSGGYWKTFDEELEHFLRVTIQATIEALGLKPSMHLRNAVRCYIMEHPRLLREKIKWNAAGVIVCRNGVVDPRTRNIQHHSELHYATYRIEADIDVEAKCPIWMAFLESALSDLDPIEQAAVIATLAEWFGAALVRGKIREMTKALILYGPSRTGKTQVAKVLRALIGGKASAMRAGDLEEHFGMQPLIGASAWIADDAITSGEFLDAERFKVIVTGEHVSVPRKNKTNWEGSLDIPVCLTANHLPRVKDDSHAVYNRSLPLPMTVIHDETAAEEKSISERVIEGELGGVLNWALDGYARLFKRLYFDPPKVMREAVSEFERENNPIGAWMDVAVEAADAFMVDRRDLLASMNGYLISELGEGVKLFGGRRMLPAIRRARPGTGNHKIGNCRYLTGIKLTEEGIGYIKYYADKNRGMPVGSAEGGNFINKLYQGPKRPIPGAES